MSSVASSVGTSVSLAQRSSRSSPPSGTTIVLSSTVGPWVGPWVGPRVGPTVGPTVGPDVGDNVLEVGVYGSERPAHKILGGSEDSSHVLSLMKVDALVREPTDGNLSVPQSTPLQFHLGNKKALVSVETKMNISTKSTRIPHSTPPTTRLLPLGHHHQRSLPVKAVARQSRLRFGEHK